MRALAEGGAEFEGRLNWAMEAALGRGASASELAKFRNYFAKQRQILSDDPDSLAKFAPPAPEGASKLETAVWTALASVLLNTDEFITRQ